MCIESRLIPNHRQLVCHMLNTEHCLVNYLILSVARV